ncbi:MerR family transcriptional regulator [Priestia sp. SB1]|uniref:MerR family transcriptional regulator n=2 Tax=Bacillaceae TaxID=186817 RepID=UPI00210D9ECB|nr:MULTISPECIES: MerR family transcriptional regulator [Priestia]MDE8675287.1 MerR family transcriptional regulator [Priestia aryabhattai]WDC90947.1 MerR family transcriptional regulator [Priestia megaterium]
MGELAEMAHVTKRTVDYYTNIGLLKAERSASNYRFYNEAALKRLYLIEKLKSEGRSLEEISSLFSVEQSENSHSKDELASKFYVLNDSLKEVAPLMEKLNEEDRKVMMNRLSPESVTLLHSLLLLLS